MKTEKTGSRPWYREPWPWLLMAGPAAVVAAGAYTTLLAVRTSDGLVADDYYKQGLAINRSLARDEQARRGGITATAQFGEGGSVRVSLAQAPEAGGLRLQLQHPTRAGLDQAIALRPLAPGLWEGRLAAHPPGRWRLQLDSADAGWRVVGEWRTGQDAVPLAPAGAERRP